eukprot:4806629-Amphidinium_carterae.1
MNTIPQHKESDRYRKSVELELPLAFEQCRKLVFWSWWAVELLLSTGPLDTLRVTAVVRGSH